MLYLSRGLIWMQSLSGTESPGTLFWGQVCTGVCCGFFVFVLRPSCVPRLASNLLGSKDSFELLILQPLLPQVMEIQACKTTPGSC